MATTHVTRAASSRRPKARPGEEVWETTTDGTVWVPIVDVRGRESYVEVGGVAGSVLRITSIDREVAQDRVPTGNDPFVNGMLRRIDADQNADPKTASDQALGTDELVAVFTKSGTAFRAAVDKLSEHNVRRLYEAMELVDATASQQAYLREKIASFRPKGNDAAYADLRGEPIR